MAFSAVSSSPNAIKIHRLPQYTYIDSLCWLPYLSPLCRHVLLATFDSDTSISVIQTHTFARDASAQSCLASISTPSRITSLKTCPSSFHPPRPIIVASTFSGSILCYTADMMDGSLNFEFSVPETSLHYGAVSEIDLNENGSECVSVGEDGRINLVNLEAKVSFRKIFDSNGLVSYSAVKWASPVEFVTGGVGGFGLHWWDKRKPGGASVSFRENWKERSTSGIVHSIDIHPSRKHTCLAGGSFGTLFAWDIRSPKQSEILSMAGFGDMPVGTLLESDIWQVRYDNYSQSSMINSQSSSRILPAMICSEDGVLGVIEQDKREEYLAEPCSINSFDIDPQNPSDVICSLEWESLVVLTRP